jgi:hypothetical protein
LDDGPPEERACFGLFCVRAGANELTAGLDHFISGMRAGPLVSGYHAGEWFAWNWWRLRYEPRSATPDWWRAHSMTAIGEGYVWPNLTIHSDGVRTVLLSKPSMRADAKPFRYLGTPHPVVIPSTEFEQAIDVFIPRLQARLRGHGIAETNLDRLWRDVLAERSDPRISKRRRLEALLGRDVDESDQESVERLSADSETLGEGAVEELAAESAQSGEVMTLEALEQIAASVGEDAVPRDAVRLHDGNDLRIRSDTPAWRIGSDAARRLRMQEKLSTRPIANETLARLAGLRRHVIQKSPTGAALSFALDRSSLEGRVVLRSRWETGRRFEVARLLADRLVVRGSDRLRAATRAYTYRQQMQRSFAAEFLSPFEAIDEMLAGDYSAEAQADVAEHFNVSPLTTRTLLVNHERLERDELESEIAAA